MAVSTARFRKKFNRLVERSSNYARKVAWRLTAGHAGGAVPVFIFGAQRSGTTMLGNCLERSPEIENLGENDRRAFHHNSLRDVPRIERLIDRCPYRFLVFKPLKDSERALELLRLRSSGKSVWMYRNYADRVNSAVKLFGRHPLDVFHNYRQSGTIAWQLRGMSEEDGKFLRDLDFDSLDEYDGAALMWYIRNSLYFNLGLQDNRDVYLLSYERFVSNPAPEMQSLSNFLGCRYVPAMVDSVHAQSLHKDTAPRIQPHIANLCDSLFAKLNKISRMQAGDTAIR